MSGSILDIIEASAFFSDVRPSSIPSDVASPDVTDLIGRIKNIDSSTYPFPAVKEILLREHNRLNAGSASMDRIGRIGSDTVFIAAGQQAGLFGGPLYTLYKAMHAVRLSQLMSEQTGRTIIPLFWIASDDHDFQEVNHHGIVSSDGALSSVSVTPAGYRDGMPVGDVMLDESITESLDTLEQHMSRGESAQRYLTLLRDCWKPGIRWSDAFARQILALFDSHGIVVFDPRWNGVKKLFGEVIHRELGDPLISTQLVNESADRFETAGMRRKALRKPDDSTNIFIEIDNVRLPVHYDGDRFTAGQHTFDRDELARLLDSKPEIFSPGAAIRPVCQDAVFPVAALISGPGERRYLSQLAEVYDFFGTPRSLPWPRASFTVIDRKTIRNAEKEQVSLPSLFADIEKIRLDLARDTFPPELEKTLSGFEQKITEQFELLTRQLDNLDPTLTQSAGKDKGRMLHSIEGIRSRAVRAHKKQRSVSESRLSAASYFLIPDGGPQERWFGYDAVLSTLDGNAFDELIRRCSPGEESHRIVMPATE